MRIGYAYPFKMWPPNGGNKLHAYQLAKRFLSSGHEVITLSDASLSGLKPASDPASFMRAIDIAYVRVDGYPLRDLQAIRQVLEESRVPVVVELNAPANENLAYSWLGGRPRPSGGFGKVMDTARRTVHAGVSWPGIWAEERYRRHLARRWSLTICVSSAVEAYARDGLGISNTRVIPNGTDHYVMHPEVPAAEIDFPPETLIVFYAGSPQYPWQGLSLLGEVARDSWEEGLPISFLIMTHSPTDQIPELPNLKVITGVGYNDVARYINASDVCVSLQPEFFWSPWGFHGSPTKFFDYLSCGKPVLASNIGQMREVVRESDCGLLSEYTLMDVKAKLLSFAQDPKGRLRMGSNGRKAVEAKYNWDRIAETTLQLFEGLVAEGDQSPEIGGP